MIFKSLKLINFKSHMNTFITFNKGITVIVGENGAGKSTILEGISFALFKVHSSQKIDNLVRNNTDEMNVELEFSHDGNDYKVVRNKKRSMQSSLFQKQQGQYTLLCKGESDVQDEIQNILSMDSALFLNAVYVQQGEIAELIGKTVAQKKMLIGKLLGLDSLEKSWKDLGAIITMYDKKLSELKGKISGLSHTNQYVDSTIRELKELKDIIISIRNELNDLDQQKEHYASKKANYENAKNTLHSLKYELDITSKQLKGLSDEIDRLEKVLEDSKDIYKNVKTIEGEIEELQQYPSILNELNEIQSCYDKLNDLANERQEAIDKCQSQWDSVVHGEFNVETFRDDIIALKENTLNILKELHTQADDAKDRYYDLNAQVNAIDKALRELSNVDGQCPVCQSKMDDERKNDLICDCKTQRDMLKKQMQVESGILDKMNKGIEKHDYIMNAIPTLKHFCYKISVCNDDISELKERLNNMPTENYQKFTIDEVQEKIDLLESKKILLANLKGSLQNEEYFTNQLNDIRKRRSALTNTIQELEEKIDAIDYNESDYQDIVVKYQDITKDIDWQNKRKYNLEGEGKKQIENLERMIEEKRIYDETMQEYSSLLEYTDTLKRIRDLYGKDGIQKDLRNASKPLIEQNTKDFFNQFNFNYSDLKIDDNYDIILYGPNGESLSHMISGGEKIAVALALRLGITKSISNNGIKTILLDEPTIHLDSERIHELVSVFNNASLLPQMIIVTHEVELENVANNLITVQKENGISVVLEDE